MGLVNGLGQSMASAARCIGPAVGGLVWSLGVRFHFLFLNFIVVAFLLVICIILGYYLPTSLDYAKKDQHLLIAKKSSTDDGADYNSLPFNEDNEDISDEMCAEFV